MAKAKTWRTLVVRRLSSQGKLTTRCQIRDILQCGTVITTCGRHIRSNISFHLFEALHAF